MASDRIRFFILDVEQKEGGEDPEIMIWGRTENGENALVLDRSFRPYFFVEPSDNIPKNELGDLIKKIEELRIDGMKTEKVEVVRKKYYGKEKEMLKITLTRPSDVPKFREVLKDWVGIKGEYEYTITFYKRYMVDKGIIPLTWALVEGKGSVGENGQAVIEADNVVPTPEDSYPEPKILAFDLELVEENDEEKIIMASVRDNRGFKKVLTYKRVDLEVLELVQDEKDLIRRLMEIARERDPDIIVTYNGDRFDFVHLSARAKKYGLDLKMGRTDKAVSFKRRGRIYSAWTEGVVHVDVFDFIENVMSPNLSSEVLTLDMVSREILGKGKKKMEWEELQRSWKESRGLENLVEYCLRDSELTLSLAKALLPQIFELCRITGQTLFDTSRMTYSQLVEWLLIRKAYSAGELIPNRPKFEEISIRRKAVPYTGGYVYPPEVGMHKNIALLDFMGLYPSITITHNVSPETLNCQCCDGKKEEESVHKVPGEDYYYCKIHPGFVTKTIEELVKKRSGVKEMMKSLDPESREYKILDNRQLALKILANASYGYYGYAGSRWYSRVCAKSITAWGRYYIQRVIKKAQKMGYEVVYGDTDSLFIKVKSLKDAREFLDTVNRSLPGVMELEFHGIYKAGLFTPAKTGLTAKKRYALIDSEDDITIRGFEKVRRDWSQIARETQEKVLLAVLRDNSPELALNIAKKTIHDIKKGNISKDRLVIYTQLTRPIKDYEQMGPHVIAAKKALARGRPVAAGSMIAYIITKGTGTISERAEPAEDAENYDPEYYINNQVIPAAMRVLAGLGYTEQDITGEPDEQYSLDRFVKKSLRSKISGAKKIGKRKK
jgi:DNA polymerase I/DNA polymerase-2